MTSTMPTPLDRRAFIGRLAAGLVATVAMLRGSVSEASTTSTEPFLGEIMMIAGSTAPDGWALCNGQLLPIQFNQALFSLLGTTYGGNGQTTFALPDLRDRVPIHFGQGPGLSSRFLGERAGEAAHTLTLAEVPAHNHLVRSSSGFGSAVSPTGRYPARNPALYPQYGTASDVAMASSAIGSAGGGQSHTNQQPHLGIHFCIALQGTFPSTT